MKRTQLNAGNARRMQPLKTRNKIVTSISLGE